MKALKPLSIVDIALPSGNGACFTGVSEDDLEATGLQYLECSDPVHARRFHHDRLGSGRDEPVSHAL